MKIDKLIEATRGCDRIPPDLAEEILGYGITEFLSEGLQYNEIVDLISRAEIAVQRNNAQAVSFNR